MTRYRRRYQTGAYWFFTSNLADRNSHALITHIDLLKHAVRLAHRAMPFSIIAWVVLPNHMHTIWQLASGDTNYPARWQLLKKRFSRDLRLTSPQNCVRAGFYDIDWCG
jgi:putative transposase